MRLLLLFLIVPILEIVVFIGVNNYIGLIYTIILVLLTATIGTLIVKRQGFQVKSITRVIFDWISGWVGGSVATEMTHVTLSISMVG